MSEASDFRNGRMSAERRDEFVGSAALELIEDDFDDCAVRIPGRTYGVIDWALEKPDEVAAILRAAIAYTNHPTDITKMALDSAVDSLKQDYIEEMSDDHHYAIRASEQAREGDEE